MMVALFWARNIPSDLVFTPSVVKKLGIAMMCLTSLGKKLLESRAKELFSGRQYACLFSMAYAAVIANLFYPGLLYSDSVVRWNSAILVADHGLGALVGASDHHPVFPILLMALFYKATGELGFFSITQVFFFAVAFFFLVRRFSPTLVGNFAASAALLLPINQVYSVFISNDSLFAIFLMGLLLSLYCKTRIGLLSVPLFLAAAVGTRINSAVIIPVVLLILFNERNNFRQAEYFLSTLLCVLLSALVLYLPTSLNMHRSSSWLVGVAWEYADMATKTKDKEDIAFLRSFGASPEVLERGTCYHGIWCGKEKEEFINKVGSDRSADLLKHYLLIAKEHPAIFLHEKWQYIKSLLGIGYTLQNAEIGRWRQKYWKQAMQPLGFETSSKKEHFIDRYFRFSNSFGKFLFKPYIVFGLFIVAAIYLRKAGGKISISSIPLFYYGSFFLTSQNHEFRYFFPVVLIFFAYASTSAAIFVDGLGSALVKRCCALLGARDSAGCDK